MKTPTKFGQSLTAEQREQLTASMRSAAPQRKRMRAHALLLSHRRYAIDQMADIYQVDRERVSQGLEWWEEDQGDGWADDPRSGRPPKLDDPEKERVVEIVRREPRSLTHGLKRIADEVGTIISGDTLQKILKAEGSVWKRMRRSLRALRDEDEYRAAEAALARFRADSLRANRAYDLWYCDEAGFTLPPSIPDAWQPVGPRGELAAAHGPRHNVLGFFTLPHQFPSFAFEGAFDTPTVIHCFDLFAQRRMRPAGVSIDNAPMHTSEEFAEESERWQKEDRYLQDPPPYCPELNLIAILWRKIKDEWLPLDAYQHFKTLTHSLFEVSRGIGSKYHITFA
jgi:transposase